MSLKNPVTPPGVDPGTVRIVAQRLNHYAIPGPFHVLYTFIIWYNGDIPSYPGYNFSCTNVYKRVDDDSQLRAETCSRE